MLPEYNYNSKSGCNDTESTWKDVPYITHRCVVTNSASNAPRSSMLKCDNSSGLTMTMWDNLNCNSSEPGVQEWLVETYLEANGSCSDMDNYGRTRKLLECVDRSGDDRPDFNTASPTPAPTGGGKESKDEVETWMIITIVGIVLIVVVALVVGGIMCCKQSRAAQ